jgi:DedD protein
MAESEDVNALKRRGRRRLVGAIALVLVAVIVLPMVFDSDPRSSVPPVSVRIPGEEDGGFAPKLAPKAEQKGAGKTAAKAVEKPAVKPAEKAPEPVAERAPEKAPEKAAEKAPETAAPKPAPKIEIKVSRPAEKAATPSAPAKPAADAERARAEAALAGGEQFFVPAGAYVDPEGVVEKLKAAKIPYYTEPIATKGGTVTRVRAGPFVSRDAAEKALKQLKDLGLKPGNVASKS